MYLQTLFLLTTAAFAARHPPPTPTCTPYTTVTYIPPTLTPCTMSNNYPCPSTAICTPTMLCDPNSTVFCGGLCLPTQTPIPVTSCTMGNDAPCLPSSTCTPTMVSTEGQPWGGQCIATSIPGIPMSTIVVGCEETGKPCRRNRDCRPWSEKCVNGRCVKRQPWERDD